MKIEDCGDHDEIFTHEDEDEARTVRHFNATAMAKFARKEAGKTIIRHRIQLVEDQVEFIKNNRGIERPKVDRLIEPYLSAPIIFIEFEKGIHLTVDGHHRIVRLWEEGRREAFGYEFPLGTWEPFLVEDCEHLDLAKLAVAEQFLKEKGLL
jgi:hypothetical protein